MLVLKTAEYEADRVRFGEILLFSGEGFIVSVRHGDFPLHEVRIEMERRPDLLAHGPVAAVYGIVDRVVDAYGPVIEELDTDIREVEIEVFSPDHGEPGPADLPSQPLGAPALPGSDAAPPLRLTISPVGCSA